jgi:DNA-binding NarL/FixJ family response regulator
MNISKIIEEVLGLQPKGRPSATQSISPAASQIVATRLEEEPRVPLLEASVHRARGIAALGSAEEALAKLPALHPDVVLMDIHLPGMSGIECIRQLKLQRPKIQIMMLTVFEDHDRIFQSLAAGSSGYLLKQTPPHKLLEAISELHQGGSPMSTQIARRVVEAFQPASTGDNPTTGLSAREKEIIALLGKGYLYKEIASQLGISVETVRTHIHNTYEKLHVRTRTEAVMKVFGRGPL